MTKRSSIRTLATIAQIIQRSDPAENPLAHIVTVVRQQMKVDVCSLYLLHDKELILIATDGLDPSSVGKVRMGIHEGLTGLAVERLQLVIVKEAVNHPRFKYFPETGEEKFQTFAGVPLLQKNKVVGVLAIQPGDTVIVDGNLGFVYINPEPEILKEYVSIQKKYANQVVSLQKISQVKAVTKDGERIAVEANVGLYSGLKRIRELGAEGIGLYRTEFPFRAEVERLLQ